MHDSEVDVDVMVVWAAKVHVMLLEAGAPAPSVSDVLDNNQVTGYLGGGTLQCEDASSVYPVAFQQLDPGTGYDAYFALATYETPPAVSASVTKLSFTTSGGACVCHVCVCVVRVGMWGVSEDPRLTSACRTRGP